MAHPLGAVVPRSIIPPINRDREAVHEIEVPDDLVETDTGTLLLDLFGRGCLLFLDGEEVAEQRGREV
jgi:hypothetical protein